MLIHLMSTLIMCFQDKKNSGSKNSAYFVTFFQATSKTSFFFSSNSWITFWILTLSAYTVQSQVLESFRL